MYRVRRSLSSGFSRAHTTPKPPRLPQKMQEPRFLLWRGFPHQSRATFRNMRTPLLQLQTLLLNGHMFFIDCFGFLSLFPISGESLMLPSKTGRKATNLSILGCVEAADTVHCCIWGRMEVADIVRKCSIWNSMPALNLQSLSMYELAFEAHPFANKMICTPP